jgi:hypothetical protein
MPRSRQNTYSRAARAALVIVACTGLVVLGASCFSTRDAIPPTTVGSAPVLPLTVWDVLYNMKLAVDSQQPVTYEELFRDNFIFKPNPSDSIEVEKNFPGAYANWNYVIETGVMEYILDPVRCKYANLQFFYEDEVIWEFTDTTYILHENYSLVLKQEAFAGYNGTARFFFRKDVDGYWFIERWGEYLYDEQDPSWGRLKGETRARM